MKPRIAIATGCSLSNDRCYQAQVSYSYINSVLVAGGAPFLLPPMSAEDAEAEDAVLDCADGLLLTGGPDIPSAFFGAEPVAMIEEQKGPRRDSLIPLCRKALDRGMTLLAICQGCQVLNVALGGPLQQDLLTERTDSAIIHRRRIYPYYVPHPVRIVPGTLLEQVIGGGEIAVPSAHHQAVGALGRGLRVCAVAPDDVIEAVEGDGDAFVLGIQWHPEKWAEKAAGPHRRLFEAFIAAAGREKAQAMPRKS